MDSIRDALSSGPDTNETIVFLVGLAAFFLLIHVAARCFARERHTRDEPQVNYLTLAVDLLGLSERDRRDLETIARLAGLEQPAAVLLSPATLAHALSAASTADRNSQLRVRIEQLCVRLFNAPLPRPGLGSRRAPE